MKYLLRIIAVAAALSACHAQAQTTLSGTGLLYKPLMTTTLYGAQTTTAPWYFLMDRAAVGQHKVTMTDMLDLGGLGAGDSVLHGGITTTTGVMGGLTVTNAINAGSLVTSTVSASTVTSGIGLFGSMTTSAFTLTGNGSVSGGWTVASFTLGSTAIPSIVTSLTGPSGLLSNTFGAITITNTPTFDSLALSAGPLTVTGPGRITSTLIVGGSITLSNGLFTTTGGGRFTGTLAVGGASTLTGLVSAPGGITAATLTGSNLTAGQILYANANKQIVSTPLFDFSSVELRIFNPSTGTIGVGVSESGFKIYEPGVIGNYSELTYFAPGGLALDGYRIATQGAYTLTANRALVSDAQGRIFMSDVTASELANLSGVTSPLQEQLDAKQVTITAGTTLTLGNITLTGAMLTPTINGTNWIFNQTAGMIPVANGGSVATFTDRLNLTSLVSTTVTSTSLFATNATLTNLTIPTSFTLAGSSIDSIVTSLTQPTGASIFSGTSGLVTFTSTPTLFGLTNTGATTLSGNVTMSGNATLLGTLTMTGLASLTGLVNNGNTTLSGPVTVSNGLTATTLTISPGGNITATTGSIIAGEFKSRNATAGKGDFGTAGTRMMSIESTTTRSYVSMFQGAGIAFGPSTAVGVGLVSPTTGILVVSNGAASGTGKIQADYNSSDGTAGYNGNITIGAVTLTVKGGIITGSF